MTQPDRTGDDSAESEIEGEEIDEKLADGAFVELARLPEGAVVTLGELARLFGKHPVSIKRAVDRGELPEPVRLMGKSIWTVRILLEFIEQRLRSAGKSLDVFKKHRPGLGM